MSHSTDDKGGKKKPQGSTPEEAGVDKRSGRVAFDSRGNSVWEWQLETGVYSRDVNTQRLKKLDLGNLSIADSGIHPQPPGLGPTKSTANKPAPPSGNPASGNPYDNAKRTGGGFNPYDNSKPGVSSGTNPYDNARALAHRFQPEGTQERRRTPADLRKLDQQIKEQRKKLKE